MRSTGGNRRLAQWRVKWLVDPPSELELRNDTNLTQKQQRTHDLT